MATYINKKTGAVLETGCKISGGDWQLKPSQKSTKKPGKQESEKNE